MSLQFILEDLGFPQKEAKVYLALLDLGEATVTKISQRASLDRVLTYQLLEKLANKGAASSVVKRGVRHFAPTDPEVILKHFQEREQRMRAALPEFKLRQKLAKPEAQVELYRGRESISTIFRMITRDRKPYFMMGGLPEACSIFEIENKRAVREAESLRLPGRVLVRRRDKFFVGQYEQFRYVPEQLISSSTMMLWGSKTAVFVWSEPYFVILIDNAEVTKGNLATFNYLWSMAEKPTAADVKRHLLKTL